MSRSRPVRAPETLPGMEDALSERDAQISPCGAYRYTLTRRWGSGAVCNFILLNPSTADAEVDDPTAARCSTRARKWGFGALVITNLFAYRSTDPKALKHVADPIGPENDAALLNAARGAARVVCGWGAGGPLLGRSRAVAGMLCEAGMELWALRILPSGEPEHPLYLPYSLEPVRFGGG